MQSDRETVTQLVKKLKEEIKHVNAFVILFNGQVDSILVDLNVFILLFFCICCNLTGAKVYQQSEKHDPAV